MVKGLNITKIEIKNMKVIFSIVNMKGMENIFMKMGTITLESLKMVFFMEMVKNILKMEI